MYTNKLKEGGEIEGNQNKLKYWKFKNPERIKCQAESGKAHHLPDPQGGLGNFQIYKELGAVGFSWDCQTLG